MGQLMISGRGGIKNPDGFAPPMQIITESGTWTCPRTGTYRVTCIGCGGSTDVYLSTITESRGFCVAGGGAGGIADSQLEISKGIDVVVTVSIAVTSFGPYLSAAAGQAGVAYSQQGSIVQTAGVGGIASGGNIGNYVGGSGSTRDTVIGGSTSSASRFGGASGNEIMSSFSNITYGAYYSIVIGTRKSEKLYQFGAGQGNAKYGSSQEGLKIPITATPNGAVIIEFIK